MSISLTQSAATRVRTYLEKRGRGVGLRVGVRRSGCNGWAYTIDYADSVAESDVVFDQQGVKVVVDAKSEVASLYGQMNAIPVTIIVDRNGKIRSRQVGMRTKAQIEALAVPLLKEK